MSFDHGAHCPKIGALVQIQILIVEPFLSLYSNTKPCRKLVDKWGHFTQSSTYLVVYHRVFTAHIRLRYQTEAFDVLNFKK